MHTRASNSELVEPLPKPERTLNRRLHRRNRRVFVRSKKQSTSTPENCLSVNFLIFLQNYDLMDDEPMWATDRVVATTLGFAITILEISNEFSIKASIQNLKTKFDILADKQSGRPFGSLPSNTQPNPQGNNSKAYQPQQSRNEHVNAVFTRSGKSYDPQDNPNDQQNNSKNPINFDSDDEDDEPTPQPKTQPPKPVKETPLPKPYKPKIPYPQRLRKEKIEAQYGKFLDMIRAVRINVPLVDVLAGMPKYGKFLKELISNKHKSKQILAAFLSDESFAILQNKVPPKLRDPGNEGSKILHFIERTNLEEEIFSKFDKFIEMTVDENYVSESDIKEPPFEKITINTYYKIKTSLEEPHMDLKIKSLLDNLEHKGDITVVTNENDELVPTRTVTGWRVCIDYYKLNGATAKDHFPLPFMDQMLERLTGNKDTAYLRQLFIRKRVQPLLNTAYPRLPIRRAACEWFKKDCIGSVTREDLVEKFIQTFYQLSDDNEDLEAEEVDDPDDITDIFKIEGIGTYEEYGWNTTMIRNLEESWSDNGVPYQLCDRICKPYHFKNGITKWPTCNSDIDGFCNGGELPGMVRVESMTYLQDHKCYGQRPYANIKAEKAHDPYLEVNNIVGRNYYTSNAQDNQGHEEHKDDPTLEPSVCKIRRFEMMKYSFNANKEYITIKESEYLNHSKDNLNAYRELLRIIDEGWVVETPDEE
nr:reverse transcriptase domain-containing protein [Tanacetum cinerariifolium]